MPILTGLLVGYAATLTLVVLGYPALPSLIPMLVLTGLGWLLEFRSKRP